MNYDTYDCRIRIRPPKAAKAIRRKNAPGKTPRAVRGLGRILGAARSVAQLGTALFAFAAAAHAQITIQPTTEAASKDTKIYGSFRTSNFSSNLNLVSEDVGAHFLSLLQFDLSSVPYLSAEITSATITLYCTGLGASGGPAVGGTVTMSPILDAWRENSGDPGLEPLATYNAFFGTPAVVDPPSPALPPTLHFSSPVASANITSLGYYTFDITDTVKAWQSGSLANNGVFIQLSTNGGDIGLADADSNGAAFAPSLTVVPEPGTALLAVAGTAVCVVRRRRQAAL
jgi:hypothetical protein